MNSNKTLGQIAHEARSPLYAGKTMFADIIPWDKLPKWQQQECQAMAEAVKLAILQEVTAEEIK